MVNRLWSILARSISEDSRSIDVGRAWRNRFRMTHGQSISVVEVRMLAAESGQSTSAEADASRFQTRLSNPPRLNLARTTLSDLGSIDVVRALGKRSRLTPCQSIVLDPRTVAFGRIWFNDVGRTWRIRARLTLRQSVSDASGSTGRRSLAQPVPPSCCGRCGCRSRPTARRCSGCAAIRRR